MDEILFQIPDQAGLLNKIQVHCPVLESHPPGRMSEMGNEVLAV